MINDLEFFRFRQKIEVTAHFFSCRYIAKRFQNNIDIKLQLACVILFAKTLKFYIKKTGCIEKKKNKVDCDD
jgi:hypothetical protein